MELSHPLEFMKTLIEVDTTEWNSGYTYSISLTRTGFWMLVFLLLAIAL